MTAMHRLCLSVMFALVASACVPAEPSGLGADLPAIEPADWTFGWDSANLIGGGPRTVDVATSPARVDLTVADTTTSSLGVLAVDELDEPSLDGRRLVASLPPGSSVTLQPDGTALFAYWDLFDPEWRGRQPSWQVLELEEGTVTVDELGDDPHPAKVATAAEAEDMLFLLDPEGGTSFHWSGELRYCFELGRPITSLALTDPGGEKTTTFDVPAGFTVRASVDGTDWVTLYRTEDEGTVVPTVDLPADMVGAENLCLGFGAGDGEFSAARRLYLTVGLDASDLTDLTAFAPGESSMTFTDGAGSSHRAVLFWDNPALRRLEDPSPTAPRLEARREEDRIAITFPNGAEVEVATDASGRPVGIGRTSVGAVPLLAPFPGRATGLPTITIIDGDLPPGEPFDWVAYRRTFLDTGTWPSRGERTEWTIDLATARFVGLEVVDDEVVATWEVPTRQGPGRIEWVLSAANPRLAGRDFAGVAMRWRVRGPGLDRVNGLAVEFPLVVSPGDREVGQSFRTLIETEVRFNGPVPRPAAVWFEQDQSFLFVTGPGRTVVGYLQEPAAARVTTRRTAGRDRHRFELPVGEEGVTATLVWAATDVGAVDRWTAADVWAAVYDSLRTTYLAAAGVADTRPLPTVVWNQPFDDEFVADLEHYVATGDYPAEGWFRRFADRELDRAEAAGVANVIIQAPWVSDAEDPELVSSFHAARALEVSPMLGGVEGLGTLVDQAHRRGISVTLWYPSAYSIRSPLFERHPDWLVWTREGIPDDGGWGDILVVDKGDAYRRYVVDRLESLRSSVPFDGVWMDSWAGIAVPTDYSEPRPVPRLDQAIAFQRAFTEMGVDQILIEGLGPFGRPDAYGDYETYSGPPDPAPEQVAEMERLRGHEYLLHRIGAGVYLDVDVYERTLASGGLVNIANLDEVDALPGTDRDRLRRLNRAYMDVRDRMDHRRLLVADGRWVGVSWTDDESTDMVVFAFEGFVGNFGTEVAGEDLTAGVVISSTDHLEAEPHHVYLIRR